MRVGWLMAALLLGAGGITAYKMLALGYDADTLIPDTLYNVTLSMSASAQGQDVSLRAFVPASSQRQRIFEERNTSAPLRMQMEFVGDNRRGHWEGQAVEGPLQVRYEYAVRTETWHWEIDPGLPVQQTLPPGLEPFLARTDAIQVDHPQIRGLLGSLKLEGQPMLTTLRRAFDYTARTIRGADFSGGTDALTTLRLGEASCNGKSRLLVAMLRSLGIPARLVGGLILAQETKKTTHQWVEAYVNGHWVAFCPTNGYFAQAPGHYLRFYVGDHVLFAHTAEIGFDWFFKVRQRLAPSAKLERIPSHPLNALDLYKLFERIGIPLGLLKILLMIPIGALVASFFRTVIGTQTFGTFLPALIAAAARESGIVWGLFGFTLVIVVVALARRILEGSELLHTAKLSAMLALVVVALLGVAVGSVRLGLVELAHLTLFPLAVLTLTSERFALMQEERGLKRALSVLAQTLFVTAVCYGFMANLFLQSVALVFPEMLLVVVALNLWLGRWVGLRVLELWRFRSLIFGEQPGGMREATG